MISRIWHGYTKLENADAYETLLKQEIFVGIKNRDIKGFRDIHLLRRNLKKECTINHPNLFTGCYWIYHNSDSIRTG
jgi:hypothetical protein